MGRLVLRGGWARLGLAGPGWGNLALGTLPSGDLAEWRPCRVTTLLPDSPSLASHHPAEVENGPDLL